MPAGASLVPPVLVFLLTIVAFLPTLQNGFVNWDDEAFLVSNPNYRGLGWKQIRLDVHYLLFELLHALDLGDLWVGLCFVGNEPAGLSSNQSTYSRR